MIVTVAPACRGKPLIRAAASVAAFAVFSLAATHLALAQPSTAALKPWRDGGVPTFSLLSADGANAKLESHRGRPVLVHFFATWCEPCKEELPALRRFVERADRNSITVLAISVAEVELRVRRFLETTPVNFPVLLDQDRAVSKAWKVTTLPSTIILDASLKPRFVVEADYAWDRVEPRELIQMLGTTSTQQLAPTTGRKER